MRCCEATCDGEPGRAAARGLPARAPARRAVPRRGARRGNPQRTCRRVHADPGSVGVARPADRGGRDLDRSVRAVDRTSARDVREPDLAARDRSGHRMTALVVALRGAAAIAVLTTLVGGIPRIVQAGLAVAAGAWCVAIAPVPPPSDVSWQLAVVEAAIGATLGLLAALPLIAAATAGRLVDLASG